LALALSLCGGAAAAEEPQRKGGETVFTGCERPGGVVIPGAARPEAAEKETIGVPPLHIVGEPALARTLAEPGILEVAVEVRNDWDKAARAHLELTTCWFGGGCITTGASLGKALGTGESRTVTLRTKKPLARGTHLATVALVKGKEVADARRGRLVQVGKPAVSVLAVQLPTAGSGEAGVVRWNGGELSLGMILSNTGDAPAQVQPVFSVTERIGQSRCTSEIYTDPVDLGPGVQEVPVVARYQPSVAGLETVTALLYDFNGDKLYEKPGIAFQVVRTTPRPADAPPEQCGPLAGARVPQGYQGGAGPMSCGQPQGGCTPSPAGPPMRAVPVRNKPPVDHPGTLSDYR
jgi:hypothetical protein